MKWKATKFYDGRIVRKFLFFPLTCKLDKDSDERETRWLCFATMKQTYMSKGWYSNYWIK